MAIINWNLKLQPLREFTSKAEIVATLIRMHNRSDVCLVLGNKAYNEREPFWKHEDVYGASPEDISAGYLGSYYGIPVIAPLQVNPDFPYFGYACLAKTIVTT